MKSVQSISITRILTHSIASFAFFLFLFLSALPSMAQQYDCSQPGGCSIMVTDYSGSVVYADTYFGPNYSLNRMYTGETYTFDIMPVFTGIDVAIYWPSTDWGDCDEVGVFYSITPNQGVTTQTWGGAPHMYLDATFPSAGSWTLTAGHDGWSCQQLHCGTTVNGCDDYMPVTLSSPPTPTPTVTPTPTPSPTGTLTPTPTPKLVITYYSPQDIFISDAPEMPNTSQTVSRAKLENYYGGVVSFLWSYKLTYTNSLDVPFDYTFTGQSAVWNSEETSWSPNFGSLFYGNRVSISVETTVGGKKYTANANDAYRILGTNPLASTAKAYIGTSPWFIQRIAMQESNGINQFNGNRLPLPNSNGDGGYGIFQLTPANDASYYWNWRANCDEGKIRVNNKRDAAYNFANNQIMQFESYNSGKLPSDPDYVSEPAQTTYNDITFSLYYNGNNKRYHDANWIKANNGATSYFLSWHTQRTLCNSDCNTLNLPHWGFQLLNEHNENYVLHVCSQNP